MTVRVSAHPMGMFFNSHSPVSKEEKIKIVPAALPRSSPGTAHPSACAFTALPDKTHSITSQAVDVPMPRGEGRLTLVKNAAIEAYINQNISDFVDPEKDISNMLKALIKQRWGMDVNPDKTYVVTFKNNGEDEKDVVEKISLTQAALKNRQDVPVEDDRNWFQKIAQYFSPVVYGFNEIEGWVQAANSRQAIYREPELAGSSPYNSATRLPVSVDDFKTLVWNTDRTGLYKKTLDGFWAEHRGSYTPLSKMAFAKAIHLQRLEGTLGAAEMKLAQRVLGPVAQKEWPELTVQDFTRPALKDPDLDIGLLRINGLQSTDVMCVTDRKTQLTLVCIPGNSSPIHRFDNPGQMKIWVARQAADPVKRESLLTHFSLKDQARKAFSDGVRQSLEGMGNWSDAQASGSVFSALNAWLPERFVTIDSVDGDPFQEVMARQKARSYSDAENAIVSDSDYTKGKIVAGVEEATKAALFMTPLALVMPEVAVALDVLFVTAGATEAGIGIDDVAKGKASGTDRIVFGVLNAVPPLVTHVGPPLAKALTSSKLLNRASGEGAAAVDAAPRVAHQPTEQERPFFNPPQRINGRIGYPMSPVAPPVIAEEFTIPMDDIHRLGAHHSIFVRGYAVKVRYDVEAGLWRGLRENGQVNDIFYWREGQDQWAGGTREEGVAGKQNEPVSIANKTLRLPRLPSPPSNPTQVPKVIHYFWAGNKMPEHLIENIIENSRKSPGYKSIVHVDADNEQVFQTLKSELDHAVGGLEVTNLKDDEVFRKLNAGKYGAMYQYFRAGQGQNLSASSDVMRVALMKKYGGIYLDTDDALTMNVGQVALNATPTDILLNNVVNYEPADFNGFNTSNFATHADNPVWEDVLETSYQRYKTNEKWLRANRPFLSDNPTAAEKQSFKIYQKKIFEVTGPRVINDVLGQSRYGLLPVIDDLDELVKNGVELPDLYSRKMRESFAYYVPMRSTFGASIGSEGSMTHAR